MFVKYMQHREKNTLFSSELATNVALTGVVHVFFPDINIQIMILSTLVKGTDQTGAIFFVHLLHILPFFVCFFLIFFVFC